MHEEREASSANLEDITAYFKGKTEAILRRYGPGPRVHYHTGLIDHPPHPDAVAEALRVRLVDAQERILHYAAKAWNAPQTLSGDVLDVGCGLGGGAIFWAQNFGARVTAVTCVASHVPWVTWFASQAGVGLRVRPVLWDACRFPGTADFDAAVAIDSSGYLPRPEWFRRLASLLRHGGRAFIADCFLVQPEYEQAFNRYWHTRIGTVEEYLAAADRAGLEHSSFEDLSPRIKHFWTTTLALIRAEGRNDASGTAEASRRQASTQAHSLVRQGFATGGLVYALLSFRRRA